MSERVGSGVRRGPEQAVQVASCQPGAEAGGVPGLRASASPRRAGEAQVGRSLPAAQPQASCPGRPDAGMIYRWDGVKGLL